MNKATKIILLAVSALLIIGGVGAAIYAIATESKKGYQNDSTETTEAQEEVEYFYDDDGNIKSERYYKNGSYIGQRDYYYTDSSIYITEFDKNDNEVASSVKEFNIVGSISKITSYKLHLLSEEIEYDYYDDLRTPKKKTVKTYVGNDVYAEKSYFAEGGKKTRQCNFLNGEILEDKYFDESGNVIENGGETSED